MWRALCCRRRSDAAGNQFISARTDRVASAAAATAIAAYQRRSVQAAPKAKADASGRGAAPACAEPAGRVARTDNERCDHD